MESTSNIFPNPSQADIDGVMAKVAEALKRAKDVSLTQFESKDAEREYTYWSLSKDEFGIYLTTPNYFEMRESIKKSRKSL